MVDQNDEVTRAWNGVLFEKWVRFKHLLTTGLSAHGEAVLARRPAQPGWRVLDLGCGFGDMSRQLAAQVGGEGEVVGVDVAQNFVDASARDAREAGVENARFVCADVQVDPLGGPYDAAYARFGLQFFTTPVAALRNVKKVLKPDSPLAFVTWRKREDNPWLHVPELCVRSFIPEEKEVADEPTCGPGPFAMRSPDLVSDQLLAGGYRDIAFERSDLPICIGRDVEEAIAFSMALGPAGEIIRLAADFGREKTAEIVAAMKDALAPYASAKVGPGPHQPAKGGVFVPSSAWIITARA